VENDNYKEGAKLFAKSAGKKVLTANIEGVFLNLKTNKCGAFFGKSASLKMLANAFKRDNIKFRFSEQWIDVATLEKKQQEAKDQAARQAAREAAEREQAARQAAKEAANREQAKMEREKRLKNMNLLEKYVMTREKRYLNEMRDSGGLKDTFFGLQIHRMVREGKTVFLDAVASPKQIRASVGKACGINKSAWKVSHGPNILKGNGIGSACDANYYPIDSNYKYSISIKQKK
jgi:ABC-type glutathione transport system ATPase component